MTPTPPKSNFASVSPKQVSILLRFLRKISKQQHNQASPEYFGDYAAFTSSIYLPGTTGPYQQVPSLLHAPTPQYVTGDERYPLPPCYGCFAAFPTYLHWPPECSSQAHVSAPTLQTRAATHQCHDPYLSRTPGYVGRYRQDYGVLARSC